MLYVVAAEPVPLRSEIKIHRSRCSSSRVSTSTTSTASRRFRRSDESVGGGGGDGSGDRVGDGGECDGNANADGDDGNATFVGAGPAGRLLASVAEVRDAAVLLSGERPYREFPLSWYTHAVGSLGLHVVDVAAFPAVRTKKWALKQLAVVGFWVGPFITRPQLIK